MELSICGDIVNRNEPFPVVPGVGPEEPYSNIGAGGGGGVGGAGGGGDGTDGIPMLGNWDFALPLPADFVGRGRTVSTMERVYTIPSNTTRAAENPTMEAVEFFKKAWRRAMEERRNWTWWNWFAFYFPLLHVIRTYRVKDWLLRDVLAGLGVAAMLVPQGMSYARLAGLPNVYGLYGSFVPLLVYAIFGTSRQLAVGPVAVTSLMLGSGLPDIIGFTAEADPNKPLNVAAQQAYNIAAVQVAFIAGVMKLGIGVLNLGFVINLLSHSVLAGFMTGASLIIGLSQAKYLMGYSTHPGVNSTSPAIAFPRHDPVHLQLGDLFSHEWLPYFKWREMIMGIAWVILLFIIKKISQWKRNGRAPLSLARAFGPITIVIISTLITGLGHLDQAPHSIKVVGTIQSGLPHAMPSSVFTNMDRFGAKITLAISICLVDVIESMSIARALAMSHNYEIDPTRELRGLGIANIVGSMFSCYTTTGSFSRSAVSNECGACSQVSGMVTGFTVMLVLLWLTPLFNKMPTNCMGSIVIFAVIGLFKIEEFFFLWKVNKFDWLVFVVAALSVMFAGVEVGLAISISVSILLVLFKTAFPRVTVLGRLPGTTIYRNIHLFPEAVPPDNGLVVRIDAPLFFGNITPIREAVTNLERAHLSSGRDLKWLVLDCSPVTDVDASAMHFLKDWVSEHRQRGVQICFCDPSEVVVKLMDRAGIVKFVGAEWIHMRVHDGVRHCRTATQAAAPIPIPTSIAAATLNEEDVSDVTDKSDDGGRYDVEGSHGSSEVIVVVDSASGEGVSTVRDDASSSTDLESNFAPAYSNLHDDGMASTRSSTDLC